MEKCGLKKVYKKFLLNSNDPNSSIDSLWIKKSKINSGFFMVTNSTSKSSMSNLDQCQPSLLWILQDINLINLPLQQNTRKVRLVVT